MASPFNSFRKNKKVWFAFLTVVAMITFVLSPSSVRLGCGRQHGEEYAVTTTSQSLTWGDLHQLAQMRGRMNQFAGRLEEKRVEAARRANSNASDMEKQPRRVGFGGDSLREVFDTWLKVQKAHDLGITISQNTVTDYIKTQSGGALSTQDLNQFLKKNELSEMGLYGALENELLAQRVDELYGFGRAERLELTPAEHKIVWDREHRRAYTQVLALPVADFARLVPEPPDEVLKQFFEPRRNLAPNPDSPDAGFQLPYLAQFEVLRVYEPRFYEAAMKAITPEEIGHRYEEEKGKKEPASFMKYEEKTWKDSLQEKEKEKEKQKTDSEPKKEPGKTPEKSSDGKPAAEKPKADGKSNGGAWAPPTSRAPREAALGGSYPVSLAAEAQDERSSGLLLAQADPAKTADAKTGDAKTSEAKTSEAKTSEAKKADTKTGPAAKQAGKTADAKEPAATSGSSATDPFKPRTRDLSEILNGLTIPDDIRELQPGQPAPKFKPLWEVEQKIREQLALEMQNDDAGNLLKLIKKPLDEYADKYVKWSRKTKRSEQDKPVNPLDDAANARKIIQDAWDTLEKEKKEAWKKTFDERKKSVDEQIKQLLDEHHVTLEQFKKLAADKKNANWEGLLKEQARLADTEKLSSDTLKAWQDRLSVKRTNLPGETAAVTPEKKAEAAKGAPVPPDKKAEKVANEKPAKKDEAKKEEVKKDDAKKDEPTEPVVSLQKTDRGRDKDGHDEAGLDRREFLRRKYPLTSVALDGNKSFIDWAFAGGPLFQPQFGFGQDAQYLFWRIDERPLTTLIWEDPKTKEVVPATRETVLQKYREALARKLAKDQAQELASKIGHDADKFPTAEVQRFFRLDLFETSLPTPSELTANERKSLTFSEAQPVYTVVAELFDNGKRSAINLPTAPPQGPLEAPAPGDVSAQPWFFADDAQARQYAVRLANAQHNPQVLVIVGKSVGEAAGQRVFQGMEGFRWQEKSAAAADETKDDTKNVISGPGRLAGRTFSVNIGSGDTATTLKITGERVSPFTWDQLPESADEPAINGLVVPGTDFGEDVFKLAPGELAVVLNRPQTIAYVVQVTGYDYYFQPRGVIGAVASVYPADTTLEASPLHQRFITDCRDAVAAQDFFKTRWQQYQFQVQQYRATLAALEQFPQFAQFQQPPRPPTPPRPPPSVLYRERRADQERDSWREALYREYGVSKEQVQRLAERSSRE